jgi:hypothetical protein
LCQFFFIPSQVQPAAVFTEESVASLVGGIGSDDGSSPALSSEMQYECTVRAYESTTAAYDEEGFLSPHPVSGMAGDPGSLVVSHGRSNGCLNYLL